MQSLPVKPSPNAMTPQLIDRGGIMRGASSIRIDRPGSRWRIEFVFPIMTVDGARAFISKLLRGQRQGLQVDIPLLVPQGNPGSPVVDGAVTAAGTALPLRGLTPGYAIKEQYWITVVESDGTAYLHSVVSSVVADGTSNATVQIEPPLRAPFADGDTVHIGKPFMQGFMDADGYTWSIRSDRFVELSVAIEEYQ